MCTSIRLLICVSVIVFIADQAVGQNFNPEGSPFESSQEIADPTIPSDAILSKVSRGTKPTATDFLASAKRLHQAGLFDEARQRIEQLQKLEDAPLEIQDEASTWWASVAPARQLLDSAKRLHDAGLTVEAQQRIKELQEQDDVPQELRDEALAWWVSVSPNRSFVANRLPGTPTRDRPRGAAAVTLPKLPTITIEGLILGESGTGTAMLEVGDRQVSIRLKPLEEQTRTSVPASQFQAMKPALDQLAAMSGERSPRDYEVSLECSFVHDGVFYNVESFTSEVLMLKALPHNEVIIVRSGNSP